MEFMRRTRIAPRLVIGFAVAFLLGGVAAPSFAAPVVGGANSCVGNIGGPGHNGINNASCTANDVSLTEIVPGTLIIHDADGGCTSTSDTVTFSAIGRYMVTSSQRYDI